jgi:hypothetical protein
MSLSTINDLKIIYRNRQEIGKQNDDAIGVLEAIGTYPFNDEITEDDSS